MDDRREEQRSQGLTPPTTLDVSGGGGSRFSSTADDDDDDEQTLLPTPPSTDGQPVDRPAAEGGDGRGEKAEADEASSQQQHQQRERPRPPPAPWHPLQEPHPPRRSSRFWNMIRSAPQHARICFAYNRGGCGWGEKMCRPNASAAGAGSCWFVRACLHACLPAATPHTVPFPPTTRPPPTGLIDAPLAASRGLACTRGAQCRFKHVDLRTLPDGARVFDMLRETMLVRGRGRGRERARLWMSSWGLGACPIPPGRSAVPCPRAPLARRPTPPPVRA